MRKVILKYGLISGIVMLIFMAISFPLMMDKANYELSELIGYTSMLLAMGVIFLAVANYRKQLGGHISFLQAFKLGIGVAVIGATMFTIADTIYVLGINPNFMEEYSAYTIEKMEADGASKERIEEHKAEMEAFNSITVLEVVMFLTVFLIGVVVSLVAAAIFKRTPAQSIA